MGLFADLNDPFVRDVVGTAAPVSVSEPVVSLHGWHCYETVFTHDDASARVVCGWPEFHEDDNPFLHSMFA